MKTLLNILTGLAVVLILVGCNNQSENLPDGIIEASTPMYDGEVTEVTLKDGTRCAVLLGYNRGGISCDWENNHEDL